MLNDFTNHEQNGFDFGACIFIGNDFFCESFRGTNVLSIFIEQLDRTKWNRKYLTYCNALNNSKYSGKTSERVNNNHESLNFGLPYYYVLVMTLVTVTTVIRIAH